MRSTVNTLAALWVCPLLLCAGLTMAAGQDLRLVDAVASRDIPLVQGSAMVFCTTYVGLNLLADLLAITANPRLRHPK